MFYERVLASLRQTTAHPLDNLGDLDHGLQAAYTGKGFTSIHAELHFSDPLSK
jgi:hypothetical protein